MTDELLETILHKLEDAIERLDKILHTKKEEEVKHLHIIAYGE